MSFLLGLPILRGYVKFPGCNGFKFAVLIAAYSTFGKLPGKVSSLRLALRSHAVGTRLQKSEDKAN